MFWNVDGRRDVVPNVGSSRNCPQARRRDLFCALAISFFFFFLLFSRRDAESRKTVPYETIADSGIP